MAKNPNSVRQTPPIVSANLRRKPPSIARRTGYDCAPLQLAIDLDVYKWRHLIENFFCKLKEFKRVAMRSDKTDTSFAAMISLAAAIINSR